MEIAWNVQNCMKLLFNDSPYHHTKLGVLGPLQNMMECEAQKFSELFPTIPY